MALGLTAATEQGWRSPLVLAGLALAVVLGIGFIRQEAVSARALLEPQLRRVHTLWTGAGITALCMVSVGSSYYLPTLLLQYQWSYSALGAIGVALLSASKAKARLTQ
ncbi:hypothetical protein ABZ863_26225 [Saccharomonospora sp. NPDC046836]|uniref:hypothetical protein n=1 Tax=Saccharomonospora sp. NPDC046836 TaxID=3156921 RepID=UPI0033DDDFE5